MFNNEKYPILSGIHKVSDLRALPDSQMDALAAELRAYIIEVVTKNGGHLASNLGAVELTLALHRVFNTPDDKLIWDVGHQCYAHKILTGRRDSFVSLRRSGGLSGFTKRSESEFDPFGTGHSSTSLSAAIGFAESARLSGSESYSIAVIGDGAMTGGLAYEALNNVRRDSRFIMILNDNEMSISASTGRFSKYLSKIRSKRAYHSTKRATRSLLAHIPLVGDFIFRFVRFIKKGIKNLFFRSNYFEDMGLYYLGPVDGHDYARLVTLLEAAKEYGRACVIHVKTVKGKGYAPAETSPELYHGISGEGSCSGADNFSRAMGEHLCTLAESDSRICAISAAMKDGCGLSRFAEKFPDRFYDVGIAEEHAAVFAAALAADGKRPVFAVYSSFLQRCYDNIIHDIALQELPVTICIDRAGLSASDGATHNGIFDIAMLCPLPNISLYAPISYARLQRAMELSLSSESPCFIRYANCSQTVSEDAYSDDGFILYDKESLSKAHCFIVTYGRLYSEALLAKGALAAFDISCSVIALEQLLPLSYPLEVLKEVLVAADPRAPLLFAEEGVLHGGLSEALTGALIKEGCLSERKYIIKAIEDPFAKTAKGQSVLSSNALSGADLAASMLHVLGRD